MSAPPPIMLATANAHKVEEIRGVFAPAGIEVLSLVEAGLNVLEPIEDQPTFAGNAALKARHYARAAHAVCLADDSGLCVDALDGAPGVRSARYAEVDGDRPTRDAANNAKLVAALRDISEADRTAHFVCVMVLADAERTLAEATGQVDGRIVLDPRGSNGFGYDPHFHINACGRTAAELAADEKNAVSHRGRAARAMLERLVDLNWG